MDPHLECLVERGRHYFEIAKRGTGEHDVCDDYCLSADFFEKADKIASRLDSLNHNYLFLAAQAYLSAALYARAKRRQEDTLYYIGKCATSCEDIILSRGHKENIISDCEVNRVTIKTISLLEKALQFSFILQSELQQR